jgi:SAM-dependent methyltransferase
VKSGPEHRWLTQLERQRAMINLFASLGWHDVTERRVLEVGCGAGSNLLDLLRLGFTPKNLAGIESSPVRFAEAMQRLPSGVVLLQGDASTVKLPEESEDVVLQCELFSSLLDAPFQWRLAESMWRWLKPGGGVLWYDTTIDGSAGEAVRGVPLRRIRELFPHGRMTAKRVSGLRRSGWMACAAHPSLHAALDLLPLMRTHVLAWIEKPSVFTRT